MPVIKVIEVLGVSDKSWEDAAMQALKGATSTVRNISGIEIVSQTAKVKDGKILAMAPYPDMEQDTIALTGWGRIDKFPVSEYTKDRVEDFIDAHLCRFNPESLPGC